MLQENFHILIVKTISRLSGFIAVMLSAILTLALFSFNPDDPSFNTRTTSEYVSNWMGNFGSYASDFLFQMIGVSSFFLCLILFSFGIRLLTARPIKFLAIKLALTPFAILTLSVFFSTIPDPNWWIFSSLGGINGSFLLGKTYFIPTIITGLATLFISLLLLSIVLELTIADWKYFFRYSFITLSYLVGSIAKLIYKIVKSIPINKIKILSELDQKINQKIIATDKKKKIKTAAKPVKINKTKEIVKRSSKYNLPSVELLTDRSAENKDKKTSNSILEQQSKLLSRVLEDYGVYGENLGSKLGPVVTLHEFDPAAGTKSSRIISLADDIARSMSSVSTRIATIPGKSTIGIELPNKNREIIFLRELIESKEYKYTQAALPIVLGKDIGGEAIIVDLAKMPHLLIAGTTGSGKSVGVNAMILSILYKLDPSECKFIMIDPKMLELSVYDGIPHLLSPVITEPGKAVIALKWVVAEMEERYRLLSSLGVRNMAGYNEKIEKALKNKEKLTKKIQTGYDPETGESIFEEVELENKKLPFIVVIVDEMADLMLVAGKEIEGSVQRLAQMARAAGIHIVMATQRPSVDVITGVIKANFPTRISFQVTSRIDSRTILGVQGAEQLLGMGDMIHMSGGSKLTRVHGPFCSDTEVENIVNFIKSQESPEGGDDYSQDVISEQINDMQNRIVSESDAKKTSDGSGDLYAQAVEIIKRDRKVSISYVQRQLRIGYNRAADLIERMEKEGVITPPNTAGKRELIEE